MPNAAAVDDAVVDDAAVDDAVVVAAAFAPAHRELVHHHLQFLVLFFGFFIGLREFGIFDYRN